MLASQPGSPAGKAGADRPVPSRQRTVSVDGVRLVGTIEALLPRLWARKGGTSAVVIDSN